MTNHLKGRFPFRLGTTSCIIPAGIVPNVKALAGRVDDIELVFFEPEETSDLPGKDEIRDLRAIAADSALSYTVHLPLDVRLGGADESARKKSVKECLRIMSLTEPLGPFAYIIHFNTDYEGSILSNDIFHWTGMLVQSVEELLDAGIRPSALCIETLSYPPLSFVEDIISHYGLSVCLDVGHILLAGYSLEACLERYFDRTRVVHLHGIENGVDHRDISCIERDLLSMLLSRLKEDRLRSRVVTLEVFNQADLERCMAVMETFL